jgi:hypothetical protein
MSNTDIGICILVIIIVYLMGIMNGYVLGNNKRSNDDAKD